MATNPRNIEQWPPATSLERNDLMIVFHGLLSFCYNADQLHCEVASYGKSRKHSLIIDVEGGTCPDSIPSSGELSTTIAHTLELVGGSGEGPQFYMPDSFDRVSVPPPDKEDFRWLLDLEGADFYDQVVSGKKPAFYRPKLFVKAGTFYTFEKTCSTFDRVNLVTGIRHHLGNIAYHIAANIRIESGQEARLTLYRNGGSPVVCRFPYGGGPYLILFWNTCREANGSKCKTNDFFHHFASFPTPTTKDPLSLELDQDLSKSPDCPTHQFENRVASKGVIVSNDEAPCGSAGYGGSPGMPPP